MTRHVRRLLVATATVVGAVLFLVSSPTSAHSVLLFSTPAASSVLPTSPDRIELGFNEAVDAKLSGIRLFDADQRESALAALGDRRVMHEASHGSDFLAEIGRAHV